MADPNVTVSYLTRALNAFMAGAVQPAIDAATGAASDIQSQIDALRGRKVASGFRLDKRGGIIAHNFGPATYTIDDATAPDGTNWQIWTGNVNLTIQTASTQANLFYRNAAGANSIVVPSTEQRVYFRKVGSQIQVWSTQREPYAVYYVPQRATAGQITVPGLQKGRYTFEVSRAKSDGTIALWDARTEIEPIVTVAGELHQNAAPGGEPTDIYVVRVCG